MDIASLAGIVLSIVLIIGSVTMGGVSFAIFVDIPSIMVVFGGATAALLLCFPLKNVLSMPLVMLKVFMNRNEDLSKVIAQIVALAETARRDGLLALEGKVDQLDHHFIRLGVQMAVDGTRPDILRDILQTEIDAVAKRHREGKSLFDQLGKFAPAFGMIGTLMGLIMMLSDMSDPSAIGKGMAVALITTLYGAVASNVIFLPFAEKLGFLNKQEVVALEIVVRGIMDIQSGENPRVIEQKLKTFLPPRQRTALREAV